MNDSIALPQQTVHAWCVDLILTDQDYSEAKTILSVDEWARYHLKRPDLARTAIASRYFLRKILSRYLNIPSQAIDIYYGNKGKPYLSSSYELEFNVTHKDQKAVMVFSQKPVGVDLEKIRPRNFLGLAKRYFAPTERSILTEADPEEHAELFYRIWTQKEAFIKVHGKSVFSDLTRFTVNPYEPGGLLTWEDGDVRRLWCRTWALSPEYCCSIMAEAPIKTFTIQISLAGKPFSL